MASSHEAYVDTSALIAFLDRSDTHHPRSAGCSHRRREHRRAQPDARAPGISSLNSAATSVGLRSGRGMVTLELTQA